MRLEFAKELVNELVKAKFSHTSEPRQVRLIESLDSFDDMLAMMTVKHIKMLCKIELESDHGCLIKAAHDTISALYIANPALGLDYLFEITRQLSIRSRARESISSLGEIAKVCPRQMTQAMINNLLKLNTDYLEVCSSEIVSQVARKNAQEIASTRRRNTDSDKTKSCITLLEEINAMISQKPPVQDKKPPQRPSFFKGPSPSNIDATEVNIEAVIAGVIDDLSTPDSEVRTVGWV